MECALCGRGTDTSSVLSDLKLGLSDNPSHQSYIPTAFTHNSSSLQSLSVSRFSYSNAPELQGVDLSQLLEYELQLREERASLSQTRNNHHHDHPLSDPIDNLNHQQNQHYDEALTRTIRLSLNDSISTRVRDREEKESKESLNQDQSNRNEENIKERDEWDT